MIAEILTWLSQQNIWVEPIFKVIVTFACIKYIMICNECARKNYAESRTLRKEAANKAGVK